MLDAARAKAIAAAKMTGLEFGLGSEGAYGPHPIVPFIPEGKELLVWHDLRTGLDILEIVIDETPTYAHQDATSLQDAESFLDKVGFPRQGLVVSPHGSSHVAMEKGIRDEKTLVEAIRKARHMSLSGQARLQTDMRAFMNPRRMQVISDLGKRLVKRLATACPDCSYPGWGWTGVREGLLSRECGCPTTLPLHDILRCVACKAEQLIERSAHIKADPAICALCNH